MSGVAVIGYRIVLNIFIMFGIGAVLMSEGVAADLDKDVRVALSCAAYARIRTSEFPATVKIFQRKQTASSDRELAEAVQGAIWTNRVDRASAIGASKLREQTGQVPTRGEINRQRAEWEKLLLDQPSAQTAIYANCQPLYSMIDTWCSFDPKQYDCFLDLRSYRERFPNLFPK